MHIKSLERIKVCFISHIEPGQVFSIGEKLYLRCRANRVVDLQTHDVFKMDAEKDVLLNIAGEVERPCEQKLEACIYNAGLVIAPWPESHDTQEVLVEPKLYRWTDSEDGTSE